MINQTESNQYYPYIRHMHIKQTNVNQTLVNHLSALSKQQSQMLSFKAKISHEDKRKILDLIREAEIGVNRQSLRKPTNSSCPR